MTQIPEIYRAGYEKAARLNPNLAARYIRHTTAADPPADGVMQALAGYEQRQIHRFINAGMEQDDAALRQAPAEVRHFFDQVSLPPAWYAPDAVHPGCRLFHRYSDLFIPAFFVVTIQNAATLISKAFYTTGRVLGRQAPRRIRQNTRHFIEIMPPPDT